jgi:DNA invertase Pin-like site-specific DNA recombinase
LSEIIKGIIEAVGYLRLSRDDGDDESSSITNQRAIISEWADKNGFVVIKWYIDDGYSGYTMSRPDFNILKKDLNDDKVDVIIVKNLSRIGRHNAKVNLFLENIEEVGKRVIAIGDNYDTYDKNSHDMVGIKTWINEKYVKDTSRNVREAISKMQKEGRIISNVPYGYVLDPFKKGHYYIDDTCARYVQDIFDLYLNGYGVHAIAKELTLRGVPTNRQLLKQRLERRGQTYTGPGSKNNQWYPHTVYNMLKNDFYIGTLTLAKTKRRTINGKPIRQEGDDLIVFENAHEAIIDKQTFKLVQEVLIERGNISYRGQKNRTTINTFTGKLYCADCGGKMFATFSRVNKRYVCSSYHTFGTDRCTSHATNDSILKEAITYFLKHCRNNLAEAIKDLDITIKNNSKDNGDTIYMLEKDLKRAEKELEVLLEQKVRETIENPTMKDIIDKTYSSMISSKYTDIKVLTTQLNDMRVDALDGNETRKELNDVLGIFDEIIASEEMTRKQVETIIDKIMVHDDGGLDIFLKGNLHELCTNYIQYKATNKEKIIGAIVEYAKKSPDKIVRWPLENYVRSRGNRVSHQSLQKILETLADQGYLEPNDGYQNGYRVVDLDKFIDAYNGGHVIPDGPRVQYNIVTLELIHKICTWVKTTRQVKKLF